MKIISFSLLLLIISYNQLVAQYTVEVEGTIYLRDGRKPIQGFAKIFEDSKKVSFKKYEINTTEKLAFEIIDSLKTMDNQLFIVKNYKGNYMVFQKYFSGRVSLLYSRYLNNYFIMQSDTLQILTKDKLRGELIALFPNFTGSDKLKDAKTTSTLSYSSTFLEPFIKSYNREKFPSEKIIDNQYLEPKLSIRFSPYLGFAVNISNMRFTPAYSFPNTYTPNYGIALKIIKSNSNFSFGVDTYYHKYSGEVKLAQGLSLLELPEQFLSYFISPYVIETIANDFNSQYDFAIRKNQKVVPFIFLGISAAIPTKKQYSISRLEFDFTPKYQIIEVKNGVESQDSPIYPLGINFGGGVNVSLSAKYKLKVLSKIQFTQTYLSGFSTRILRTQESPVLRNTAISVGISLSKK